MSLLLDITKIAGPFDEYRANYLKIVKARDLAKSVYSDKRRACGESVFDHISRVAKFLEDYNIADSDMVVVAYLHHILIDRPEMGEDIKRDFGEDIYELADGYRHISKNEFRDLEPSEKNEGLIIQTFLALADDPRVLILRVLDKTDNIKSVHALEKPEAERVAKKALYFYSPLARLVHLSEPANILENNAFRYLYPDSFHFVNTYVLRLKPKIDEFFHETLGALRDLVREAGMEADISSRLKHEYGIFRKALYYRQVGMGRAVSNPLENINDIVGVRVVVKTQEQCYRMENLIKQLWPFLPEKRDDYIENPRPSGYKGIHNILCSRHFNFEVQIRTHEMHEFNEYGPASTVLYKLADKDKKQNKKALQFVRGLLKDNPYWVKDMSYLNLTKAGAVLGQEGKAFDRVYVFTPKGEIIELPRGANLIDFAYAVHKDLGNSCVGGWVNNAYCKLTHVLKTGDLVKIKVSKKRQVPSIDWLGHVRTDKAKREIRRAGKVR